MAFFITACALVFVDIIALFLIFDNRRLYRENTELRAGLPILSLKRRENLVMRYIRKIVYWLGYRPNPRSIFFSPSIDLMLKAKEAIKHWDRTMVITEDMQIEVEKRHNARV